MEANAYSQMSDSELVNRHYQLTNDRAREWAVSGTMTEDGARYKAEICAEYSRRFSH